MVIDRLGSLFAQFITDGPPGLLCSDRCAVNRVAAGGDTLHLIGDDITERVNDYETVHFCI